MTRTWPRIWLAGGWWMTVVRMVLTGLTIVIWSIPLLWTLMAIWDMIVGIFLKFVPSGR